MSIKNKSITFVIFIFANCSSLFAQNIFELNGILPSGYTDKIIYFEISDFYSSNPYKHLDSTLIQNNSFHFTGAINKDCERSTLYIKDKNGSMSIYGPVAFYLQFLIDKGKNLIYVNKFEGPNWTENKLKNVKFIPSVTNDLFQQQDSLQTFFYNNYAIHDLKDPGFSQLPKERDTELQQLILQLIQKNRDNYYDLIYLRLECVLGRVTEEELLSTFNTLSLRLKETELGKEVYQLLTERINNKANATVGKSVPEFTVQTFEGKNFSNKELIGQPYLIVFSATWCIPCQQELPELIRLYNKYKDRGLKVIYFNLDDNQKVWAEHIKKNNLTWINVSERTKRGHSRIAEKYYTYSIPSSFLVNKSGRIIYNSSKMDNSLTQLESYVLKVL